MRISSGVHDIRALLSGSVYLLRRQSHASLTALKRSMHRLGTEFSYNCLSSFIIFFRSIVDSLKTKKSSRTP